MFVELSSSPTSGRVLSLGWVYQVDFYPCMLWVSPVITVSDRSDTTVIQRREGPIDWFPQSEFCSDWLDLPWDLPAGKYLVRVALVELPGHRADASGHVLVDDLSNTLLSDSRFLTVAP
jgi:hypothetical protein